MRPRPPAPFGVPIQTGFVGTDLAWHDGLLVNDPVERCNSLTPSNISLTTVRPGDVVTSWSA